MNKQECDIQGKYSHLLYFCRKFLLWLDVLAFSDCSRYPTKENPTQIFAVFKMLNLKHICQWKTVPEFKKKKRYDSINPVNGPSKLYILIYILSWLLGNIYFFEVRTIFLIRYVVIIQSSIFKGEISLWKILVLKEERITCFSSSPLWMHSIFCVATVVLWCHFWT